MYKYSVVNGQLAKKIEYHNRLYLIAYMAIAIKGWIAYSEVFRQYQWISDIVLTALFMIVIIYKIMVQDYSRKSLVMIAVWGLLCVYTYYKAHYYFLIASFFCIVGAEYVDFKKVLKVSCYSKIAFIGLHLFLFLIFLLFSPSSIHYSYRAHSGIPRYTFLLSHANTFSMLFVWTIFEYIYVNYKKISNISIVICGFLIWFFYLFTDSNTSIITGAIVVILTLVTKNVKKDRYFLLDWISKYLFLICSVVFPFLVAVYTRLSGSLLSIWEKIDDVFTGRLLYGALVYDTYGYSLFGRTLYFAKKTFWRGHWFDGIGCDNTYVWMFVCYGYAQLLIFAVAFILINKKISIEAKIFLIAYAAFGVMEAYIINATLCFPLLFLARMFFDDNNMISLTEREKIARKQTS